MSMPTISEDNTFLGVLHETIAITSILKGFLDTAGRLEIVLCSTICTSNRKFFHVHFQYGAWFFILACPLEVGCFLLDELSLLLGLKTDAAWNAIGYGVASFFVSCQYFCMLCQITCLFLHWEFQSAKIRYTRLHNEVSSRLIPRRMVIGSCPPVARTS